MIDNTRWVISKVRSWVRKHDTTNYGRLRSHDRPVRTWDDDIKELLYLREENDRLNALIDILLEEEDYDEDFEGIDIYAEEEDDDEAWSTLWYAGDEAEDPRFQH